MVRVIPNGVPRFFFPAAFGRARDAQRDLLFVETSRLVAVRSVEVSTRTRKSLEVFLVTNH
jgi:hypothetical protein